MVDSRTGIIQATIYPLDKTRHADGRRRPITPSSRPLATMKDSASDPQAPLMRHLLAQFAATGLPPAYLEIDDASPNPEPGP